MDRRPLIALLAAGLLAAAPVGAGAAPVDELLAQSSGQSLSDTPPTEGLTAQSPSESLRDTPPSVSGNDGSKSDSNSDGAPAAPAAALPYTGSDPRITLMLGFAALLAGAGLRLRTGDARDF